MAPIYLLLIAPMLIAWFAQARVRDVFKQYDARPSSRSMVGLDVAKTLLTRYGLSGVSLDRTAGSYTDHYNPQTRTLRLSDSVAGSSTVTSMSVVAHEVAHARQDVEGYRAMQMRGKLGQALTQAAKLSTLVFIGGFLLGSLPLMIVGVAIMGAQALFALVTLPVERNASRQAEAMLEETGLAGPEERRGIRQVLRAAALTYLAGLGRQVAVFLVFVAIVGTALGARL